jgi:hypothetical protein
MDFPSSNGQIMVTAGCITFANATQQAEFIRKLPILGGFWSNKVCFSLLEGVSHGSVRYGAKLGVK